MADLTWLYGVLAGGALTFGGAGLQRMWALRDREANLKEERMREVRSRADGKAEQAYDSVIELEELIRRRSSTVSNQLFPPEDRPAAAAILGRIERDAEFLPAPLRGKVRVLPRLFPDLDHLFDTGYVSDFPRTVAHRTIGPVKDALGRYLRNEVVSAELDDESEQYMAALNEFNDYIEAELEKQERGPS
ncbi:hypothetical protein [Isoptericola sp. NPDC056605]|uniref:hypothetical protein n=1 Tax=Isoptericola sp. NPDC056605 TaxID=3345876 RepID=UPI003696CE93